MISVQNHRLQLSGSNLILFLLVVCTIFYSCSTSKKSGKKKPIPKKEDVVKRNPLPDKIDTIFWKEIPNKSKDKVVIVDDKVIKKDKITKPLTQLKLMVLIPFKSNEVDASDKNIPINNLRFVHYYAGMKMALEEFKNTSGIPIQFDVFDTGENDLSREILTDTKNTMPNVIIGPYKSDALKFSAEWAKKNETFLISPWISSSTITEKNPYYFQAKAGLNSHYQLINEHVRAHFPIENVVLVSRSKEDSKLKLFNGLTSDKGEMREEIISEEDLAARSEPLLDKFFKPDVPIVFILPLASSKDENYIYHFLRRVMSEKKNRPVYIYGLYKWLEMKTDITEYINTLKVRITISNFVDGTRAEVKVFKRKYFDLYREFPSEDALEAYDLTKYLITSFKNYGNQFYLNADESENDYLQTQFQFKPVYKYGDSKEIDYYENKYIKLVEIRDNKFRIID